MKQMLHSRWFIGSVVVIFLLTLSIGGRRLSGHAADATDLSVVQIQTGDLMSAVTATGTVQAHRTVDIKYDAQSLVTRLKVKEGDVVQVNQSLAEMDLRLLEPALTEAKHALDKDRAMLSLADASLNRARQLASAQVLARADLESSEATYKSLLNQAEADKGAVTLAEEQIKRAQLRSPIRGTVIALYVHEGEMLGSATAVAGIGPNSAVSKPTNTLMTIAENGGLEIDADVNSVDLGGVFEGQDSKFTLDCFQGKVFVGKVDSIALQPTVTNGVTTYRVVVAVPKQSQDFRIGMPSNVMLFRPLAKSALLVPPGAIAWDGNQAYLLRVTKKSSPQNVGGTAEVRLEKIPVEVVGQTSSAVAVRGGISPQSAILVTPVQVMTKDGWFTARLNYTSFKPNPELSDLQFERKAAVESQMPSSAPTPQPKNFIQRLLDP